MKNIFQLSLHKKFLTIVSTILLLSLSNIAPSYSQDNFPISFPAEIKEKNMGVSLFYSDNFTLDNKISAPELRAEIKANFLENGNGVISEISFQNMFGTNPAIISGLVPKGDAYSQDVSGLIGYRFSFFNTISIAPFVKGRGFVTRGRGGDNIYGTELGSELEWKIYPESTFVNIKYGLFLPFLHKYTGEADKIGAYSFLLNNLELKLRYRFLPDFEVMTGYHLREIPKQLGTSNFSTKDTFFWGGVLLGIAYVF
ncbi:MAG: hypothetical protein AABZ74_15845 [Cyanobacteriota bacterium]